MMFFIFFDLFKKTSELFFSHIFLFNTTCFGSCPVHVRYITLKGLFSGENPLMLGEMPESKSHMELSCHFQRELFQSKSPLLYNLFTATLYCEPPLKLNYLILKSSDIFGRKWLLCQNFLTVALVPR